jgi:two-component system alkaline phosphatase synthesis response regulator PhoP
VGDVADGGTRPKILVVEDEAHLAEGLLLNLDAEGYAPILARTGREGLERARRGGLDLIVLDVMLPELSGFDVCEELRRSGSRVPILFLTARGRAEDRVRGLELGGDDYLAKPFHLGEFLTRVRALLRRQAWYRESPTTRGPYRFGGNEVDFTTGDYVARDGTRDRLTDKEAGILRLLVERRGEAVPRGQIIERLWGADEQPTARTVDNFVLRLRKRFEEDPARPRHIQTVFGVGYRFVE